MTSCSLPAEFGDQVSVASAWVPVSPASSVIDGSGTITVPRLSRRTHWYWTVPAEPLPAMVPVAVTVPLRQGPDLAAW